MVHVQGMTKEEFADYKENLGRIAEESVKKFGHSATAMLFSFRSISELTLTLNRELPSAGEALARIDEQLVNSLPDHVLEKLAEMEDWVDERVIAYLDSVKASYDILDKVATEAGKNPG